MTKALIFDCFGVLYRGSRDYLYERVSDENRQQLADLNRASDYGYVTEVEYLEQASAITGFSPADLEELFKQAHRRNDELFELISHYRQDYKIGLLSNVGRGVMDNMISPNDREELFDGVVLSSDVGTIKPYPEIYELMAQKLGVEPEDCIMIDDMPSNVSGAEETGMRGVVFKTTKDLQIALANLGVKRPQLA